VRPAINVGISVSRVGGDAQVKAMKDVAGTLRLDLSQYRELEAFAQFGSDLDEATQRKLSRGERIVEVLKQPQYSPMNVTDQIMIIYTVINGYLDDIPVDNIERFEKEFLSYMNTNFPEIVTSINEKGELSDEIEEKMKKNIIDFKKSFSIEEESIIEDNNESKVE